jgi:hypothetical protein
MRKYGGFNAMDGSSQRGFVLADWADKVEFGKFGDRLEATVLEIGIDSDLAQVWKEITCNE